MIEYAEDIRIKELKGGSGFIIDTDVGSKYLTDLNQLLEAIKQFYSEES